MESHAFGQMLMRTSVAVLVLLTMINIEPIKADSNDDKLDTFVKSRVEPVGTGVPMASEDGGEPGETEEMMYKSPRLFPSPYFTNFRSFGNPQARMLSPYALQHFIASRFKNADFGKRMGSEFLGKRSGSSQMLLPQKKMGSEFLGRR